MMVVETDRLLLRPWREDDGAELEWSFSDPAVLTEAGEVMERRIRNEPQRFAERRL